MNFRQQLLHFNSKKNLKSYLLAAFFLNSAAKLLVTRFRTLSIKIFLACSPTCKPTFLRAKFRGDNCKLFVTDALPVPPDVEGTFICSPIVVVAVLYCLLHKFLMHAVPCLKRRFPSALIDIFKNPQGAQLLH